MPPIVDPVPPPPWPAPPFLVIAPPVSIRQ